jgi:hypothetical protein
VEVVMVMTMKERRGREKEELCPEKVPCQMGIRRDFCFPARELERFTGRLNP